LTLIRRRRLGDAEDLNYMENALLRALSDRRQETRARWEVLLRIERVNTPLANPDALVHLFDWTLDEVFSKIQEGHASVAVAAAPPSVLVTLECQCGRNPFVAYFRAAKQALTEALVLEQSETALLNPSERDSQMAELRQVIDAIGQGEIAAFCALCTHRPKSLPTESDRERGYSAEEN